MFSLLENKELSFIEEWNVISTGYNTIFTIYATDSSVLNYLNNNEFPVVYSSFDTGIILVSF